MAVRILIIRPHETISDTIASDDTTESLRKLQGIVGGYVEGITIPEFTCVHHDGVAYEMGDAATLFVLEDPHTIYDPKQHRFNTTASRLAGQAIIGTAVLAGAADGNGDIIDLTDRQIEVGMLA